MAAIKVCNRCGEAKPLEAFSRKADGLEGRRAVCKECCRLQAGSIARKRQAGDVLVRDQDGRKQCLRCQQWLEESCYSAHAAAPDLLQSRCTRCVADAAHRLSVSRRNELLAAQMGRCAGGCGFEFDMYGGVTRTYNIDHDHDCCPGRLSCGECIRGLLCRDCNQANVLAAQRISRELHLRR